MTDFSPDSLPKRFDFRQAEQNCKELWQQLGIGVAKYDVPRSDSFVIDSPPPTVSGSLHIGHIFSYTHQDIIARQRRMNGFNVVYPMGWDDNGLPTERRVQNYYGVRAEPDIPYIEDLDIEAKKESLNLSKSRQLPVSRQNFIELCQKVTEQDEKVFEDIFRHMGYSIDWQTRYATVSDYCRRIAQYSFLDLNKQGHVYQLDAPTMWDIDFQTAVAQAEVEDRISNGAYHDICFGVENSSADGGKSDSFVISTTRPELLAACVGVVAHPDDKRYQRLFGKNAITPVFFSSVPIFSSEHVDMEKGTGILMVCTFGDQMDVQWWKDHQLELRQIIGKNGRLNKCVFGTPGWGSLSATLANANYGNLEGQNLNKARQIIVDLLRQPANSAVGEGTPLQGEPRPIQHSVRYYERGKHPLEYLSQRQWFVRLLDKKEPLIEMGQRINWHPAFMLKRYVSWVENLNIDWCISRQRYFGVPIPVWYKLDGDCNPDFENPIIANVDSLPMDPMLHPAPGYTEQQRGKPNGFSGEKDVFDTWFTSSLTPQIVAKWNEKDSLVEQLLPMDIRPQAHEIIRTWAFYTIAKSLMHHADVPWHNTVISGWVLDPERKKMSKSKDNVVTPIKLLEQFGTDAIRYWAGSARLGTDTAIDENTFKIGSKLVTKIFNASKFAYLQGHEKGEITSELDKAFIAELRKTVARASCAFEKFEFSVALDATENFFWNAFTDNYIELIKGRTNLEGRFGESERISAQTALHTALSSIIRLFAPFMTVVTEEVWSWVLAEQTGYKSVHQAPWPSADNEPNTLSIKHIAEPEHSNSFDVACGITAAIRKAKSENSISLKTPLTAVEVCCPSGSMQPFELIKHDIAAAANVTHPNIQLREIQDKQDYEATITF